MRTATTVTQEVCLVSLVSLVCSVYLAT